MLLIETSINNDNEVSKLTDNLSAGSFLVVKPKHFDGAQTVQVIIDLAKIIVPSAISAICTYLIATRNKPNITIKFNHDNTVEAEIEGKLNDKSLIENELYKYLFELLKSQTKGFGRDENND